MDIDFNNFNSLELNQKMELINHYGYFVGNRIYYNHKVNLYTINKFFVEVRLSHGGDKIEEVFAVDDEYAIKAYQNLINLNV